MARLYIFVQMWVKNMRFGQNLFDFRPKVGKITQIWTKIVSCHFKFEITFSICSPRPMV